MSHAEEETGMGPLVVKKRSRMNKAKKAFMDNSLMIFTLIGVGVGFGLGFGVRLMEPSADAILWLEMPGEIFIRLLKLTVLPIIASNVVLVTASLDPKVNGKISLVAFSYIVTANVVSSVLGLSCALVIKPGVSSGSVSSNMEESQVGKLRNSDVFADLILNIFPDNLVGTTLYKAQTRYLPQMEAAVKDLIAILKDNSSSFGNGSKTVEALEVLDKRMVTHAPAVNMIGVLFCAVVFGLAARSVEEKGKAFLSFFKSLCDVVLQLMRWFLWLTPVGACFMVAGSIAKVTNIGGTFSNLGIFILTVTVGLSIHFFLMNLVLLLASRRNPFRFLTRCFKSWLICFVTTTTVVAIPEMYDGCQAHGISPTVYRFVVPFSVALKKDGAAVYVTSAAVFVAQMSGVELDAGSIAVIGILTAALVMGMPTIPSAAIVILLTVLSSVGIPASPVALLFSVEWLLDRMRSGETGLGHPYCAAFTHYICMKDRAEEVSIDVEADDESTEEGV